MEVPVPEAAYAERAMLVLWDVDHTLIENHGVNKETYAEAFRLLTGDRAEYPAQTDGRTEPEIMRNMLVRHGIDPTDEHIARLPEVLEDATSWNIAVLRQRGHELPGAREALTALRETPGLIQSVLSGNIKPNAIIKLATFGLDAYIDFEVGGYGSDDRVRDNLVRYARDRASAKYGVKFDESNTVLIGDTPRDVQAGRNGGAYVIAVASGSDSMDTLRKAGADVVLPDLRDTRSVVATVTGIRGSGCAAPG
jgi:phosphoglycolate phosphatase-like HAD superfamily hydrolase